MHPTTFLLQPLTRSGSPATRAVFLERIKRFTVRAWLPEIEEETLAHLGDPGRLKGILEPGTPLLLDGPFRSPTRKTNYTAILAQAPHDTWISIDTQLPNRLLLPLLEQGYLPSLWHPPELFPDLKREVKVGHSRLDGCIQKGKETHYIECKSLTWAEGTLGLFPDAPTQRGERHLRELIARQESGNQTTVLFIAGRNDITQFAPASDIDPAFSRAYADAIEAGVNVIGISVRLTPEGVLFAHHMESHPNDPRRS